MDFEAADKVNAAANSDAPHAIDFRISISNKLPHRLVIVVHEKLRTAREVVDRGLVHVDAHVVIKRREHFLKMDRNNDGFLTVEEVLYYNSVVAKNTAGSSPGGSVAMAGPGGFGAMPGGSGLSSRET